MTTMTTTKVEATPQNINDAVARIAEYAKEKGYQFNESEVPAFREQSLAFWQGRKLSFESKSQEKVCRNYLTRFTKSISMSQANRFLHYLWRHVMKMDGQPPRVEYSEREQKIKAARKAWKTAQAEAEKLQAEYKTIKGDFYKSK